MHPAIVEAIAAERVRDMRAAADEFRRVPRRRGRFFRHHRTARDVRHPQTCLQNS